MNPMAVVPLVIVAAIALLFSGPAFVVVGLVVVGGFFFVLCPMVDKRRERKEIEARKSQPNTPLQREIRERVDSIPALWPFVRR